MKEEGKQLELAATVETNQDEIQTAQEASPQDILITELRQENLKLKNRIRDLELKSLQVHKDNQEMKAAPEVAAEMARLELDMKKAKYFCDSGALPFKNPAQAYVIMKAGQEMGLQPMEAAKSLYIVNGQISAWGMGMVSILTRHGYKIEFVDETKKGVTVIITHKNGFCEQYVVDKEQEVVLQHGKAMGFAPKNRMRFHGIRQIIKFHLPHLFGPVGLEDKEDFEASEKALGTYDPPTKASEEEVNEILENITKIDNKDDLVVYFNSLDQAHKTEDVMNRFTERKREIILSKSNSGNNG